MHLKTSLAAAVVAAALLPGMALADSAPFHPEYAGHYGVIRLDRPKPQIRPFIQIDATYGHISKVSSSAYDKWGEQVTLGLSGDAGAGVRLNLGLYYAQPFEVKSGPINDSYQAKSYGLVGGMDYLFGRHSRAFFQLQAGQTKLFGVKTAETGLGIGYRYLFGDHISGQVSAQYDPTFLSESHWTGAKAGLRYTF